MVTSLPLPRPANGLHWPPLKQVIDGKAYNTATATLIYEYLESDDTVSGHRHPYGMEEYPYAEQMFRTRFGKFFLVIRNESSMNPAHNEIELKDRIIPLESDKAIKWMEKHCNDKIDQYVEVPEAGEPSTTLTLRLDKILKIGLNAAAIQEGVSMNVWCVRALDAAIEGVKR